MNKTIKLDINLTMQIKGLAILLVIVSHVIQRDIIDIPFLIWGGQMGVSLFLILSGYGLTKSYNKNGTNNYFFKRFDSVIFPYFLVTLLWVIINIFVLGYNYNQIDIFLSLIGLNFSRSFDPSMWYITYSLLWYFVFFVVFSLPFKNIIKIGLLMYFSFLIMFHFPQTEFLKNMNYQFRLYAFMFPIGVVLGLYFDNIIKILKRYIPFWITGISFVCLGVFFTKIPPFYESVNIYHHHIYNVFWSIGVIGLFMMANAFNLQSRILSVVGKYSYEIYLFEFVFLFRYDIFTLFNNYVGMFVYIVLVISLSILLKKILPIIKNLVYSKDKIVLDNPYSFTRDKTKSRQDLEN